MKTYTPAQIQKYEAQAQKYYTDQWHEKYGWLQPYDIAWEKMQEVVGNELYLKCKCNYPNCPTMEKQEFVTIRYNKLNGYEQISCAACASKAKQGWKQQYTAGQIVCGTQKLIRSLSEKEKRELLGLTNCHCKYWKTECIQCHRTNYIHNEQILNNSGGCTCQRMTINERKIMNILESWMKVYPGRFSYVYQEPVKGTKMRFDFAIFNPQHELIFAIEYDGEFHKVIEYEPGGIENTQRRDENKNQWCLERNIPILRIDFTEQNLIESTWLAQRMMEEIK